MKKLAVVTVNYNTKEDTDNFLNSLAKCQTEDIDLEIIIVDNGSKEVYSLPSHAAKNITLVRSDENTGFSGGYNIGTKEALERKVDYIMLVNNDTLADERLLTELFAVLESDSKIGLVVPKIYFARGHEFHKEKYTKDDLGNILWYAGGHIDWNHVASIHRGVDEVDHGQYDKTEETDFATGCCMLLKRELLDKVGVLDDTYFLYYEDADLNIRIQKAGYKMYYAPKAKLVHVNAASSGGAGNGNVLQDYFITRNRLIFGMRYAPLRTKIALLRESVRLLQNGREYQKLAVQDFYKRNFGKGSFFKKKT